MRSGTGGDEKLRAIGSRPSISLRYHVGDGDYGLTFCFGGKSTYHREQERLSVFYLEVLVFELLAIDGLSSSSVPHCKVTSLDHKSRIRRYQPAQHHTVSIWRHAPLDDSMEVASFVAELLARLPNTFLPSAERT